MAITDRRFFGFDATQTDLRGDNIFLGASYHVQYDFGGIAGGGCVIQVTNLTSWPGQGFGNITWWAGPLQDNGLGTPDNPTLNNDSVMTIALAGGGVNSPTPVGAAANVTFWQTKPVSGGLPNPPTQFQRLAGIITLGDPTVFGDEREAQDYLFNNGYYTDAVFSPTFP